MSVQWIAIILTVSVNILAWVYTYGKLSQRVMTLANTLDNGLCEQVNKLSIEVAYLKGIIELLVKQLNDKEK